MHGGSEVDFLKLSFTEVYMDNNIQVSWFNVPQFIRTEQWPDYDKLPELVPFRPPCPPGGAGGEGCAVVGGKRTKKTRRFNGKSKRTRKVKRTKRSP
jgi:hypothetical protein